MMAEYSETNLYDESTIKTSVLTLINHYQDEQSLKKQVSVAVEKSKSLQKEGLKRIAVYGFREYNAKRRSIEKTSCQSIYVKLKELIKNCEHAWLEESDREEIEVYLEVLKVSEGFCWDVFINDLTQSKIYLPLELCWMLCSQGIMSYSSYFQRNISSASHYLVNGLKEMIMLKKEDHMKATFSTNIIEDILMFLVRHVYDLKGSSEGQNPGISKLSSLVLEKLVLDICDNISADVFVRSPVHIINQIARFDVNVTRKFATHQVLAILKHNPSSKVIDVLTQQDKLTFVKNPGGVNNILKQMMVLFEPSEVLGIFKRVNLGKEANWNATLSFVATFIVCYKDSKKIFSEFVQEFISQSINKLNCDDFLSAILLVRQACLESGNVFPSYMTWFQEMFQNELTSPINNKKAFTFFVKVLSDIVPYEPAYTLRAHILKPPFIPLKCNNSYNDYIALAKTRLTDLKETVEGEIVIFNKDGKSNGQNNQLQSDISKAIAAFRETGKIPSAILEVSMFRRTYYIGKFLPELLKPRVLPENPDCRVKFIGALQELGKIPMNMFNSYIQKCKELSENGYVSDESITEVTIPNEPLDKLQFYLEELIKTVADERKTVEAKVTDVRSKIATVSATLSEIIDKSPLALTEIDTLKFDLDSEDFSPEIHKVSDCVFQAYRKTCESVPDNKHDFGCISLISTLSRFPTVCACICQRVINSLESELLSLDEVDVMSMACFTAEIWSNEHFRLIFQKAGQEMSLLEMHTSIIPLTNTCGQSLQLRYMVYFINYAISTKRNIDLSSPTILQHFNYLLVRFCPHLEKCWISSLHRNVLNSNHYQLIENLFYTSSFRNTTEMMLLPAKDWVQNEMSINPFDDLLNETERHIYHDWYIDKLMERERNLWDLATSVFQSILQNICKSQTPKLNRRCMHKLRHHVTEENHHTSSLSMIALLHMIIYRIQLIQCPDDSDGPWLFRQLLWCCNLVTSHQNDGFIIVGTELMVFFRIASRLPVHLLFKNHAKDDLDKQVPKQVGEMLQSLLRNICCDGKYGSLPYHITSFILKALNCDSRLTSAFLKRCPPSLSYSIMVHWQSLKNVINFDQTLMEEIWQWANRSLAGIVEENSMKPWLKGSSLYAVFQNHPHFRSENLTSNLLTVVAKLETEASVEFLLCILVDLQKLTPMESMQAAFCEDLFIKILKNNWTCIVLLLNHLSNPSRKIFADNVYKVMAYPLFRCLIKSTVYECNSCATSLNAQGLEILLGFYNSVMQDYELYEESSQHKDQCGNSSFIVNVFEFMKKILIKMPTGVKDAVSKTVIQTCDQNIQVLFLHTVT